MVNEEDQKYRNEAFRKAMKVLREREFKSTKQKAAFIRDLMAFADKNKLDMTKSYVGQITNDKKAPATQDQVRDSVLLRFLHWRGYYFNGTELLSAKPEQVIDEAWFREFLANRYHLLVYGGKSTTSHDKYISNWHLLFDHPSKFGSNPSGHYHRWKVGYPARDDNKIQGILGIELSKLEKPEMLLNLYEPEFATAFASCLMQYSNAGRFHYWHGVVSTFTTNKHTISASLPALMVPKLQFDLADESLTPSNVPQAFFEPLMDYFEYKANQKPLTAAFSSIDHQNDKGNSIDLDALMRRLWAAKWEFE